jgi:hypothetical protein
VEAEKLAQVKIPRRSEPVAKGIAILVVGGDAQDRAFMEDTTTVLSCHGAGIVSTHKLAVDQEPLMVLKDNNKETAMRVVGQLGAEGNSYTYCRRCGSSARWKLTSGEIPDEAPAGVPLARAAALSKPPPVLGKHEDRRACTLFLRVASWFRQNMFRKCQRPTRFARARSICRWRSLPLVRPSTVASRHSTATQEHVHFATPSWRPVDSAESGR